jgi:hypothetical protein
LSLLEKLGEGIRKPLENPPLDDEALGNENCDEALGYDTDAYVGSSGNINGQFYQNSFTSGSGFPSVASNEGFQNTAFSSGSEGSIGRVGSSYLPTVDKKT